jgi:hypothetical protein
MHRFMSLLVFDVNVLPPTGSPPLSVLSTYFFRILTSAPRCLQIPNHITLTRLSVAASTVHGAYQRCQAHGYARYGGLGVVGKETYRSCVACHSSGDLLTNDDPEPMANAGHSMRTPAAPSPPISLTSLGSRPSPPPDLESLPERVAASALQTARMSNCVSITSAMETAIRLDQGSTADSISQAGRVMWCSEQGRGIVLCRFRGEV